MCGPRIAVTLEHRVNCLRDRTSLRRLGAQTGGARSTQIRGPTSQLGGPNFSTYSAREAATSRPRSMSAGQATISQYRLQAAVLTVDAQVRAGVRTSAPIWATMQRVPGRCSSV